MNSQRKPDARYLSLMRQDCPLPPGTPVDLYCRDSGGEAQERSVQQQLDAGKEYAAAHHLVIENIYIDDGLTGSNAERRDELNRMLSNIAANHRQIRDMGKRERHMAKHPRGVLFWKANRLGRDSIETNLIKYDLRVRGITIVNLVPQASTGDAAVDAMLDAMQQLQDEKLLEQISKDSKRGLADLVGIRDTDAVFRAHNPDWPTRDGRYVGFMPGVPPRGFQKQPLVIGTHDRKRRAGSSEARTAQRLVPLPDEWTRARKAWEMKLAGATIDDIMRETRLYKSAGGYTSFFRNRIYTGVLEFGGREYIDFVPALVTQAEFDAVQAIIKEAAAKRYGGSPLPQAEPRRRASRHLLSGLVYCGAHDAPVLMHANVDGHGWDHYQCPKRAQCGAKRVSAAAMNRAVTDALLNHVLTPQRLRKVSALMAEQLQQQSEFDTRALAEVEAQLRDARAAVDQLVDAVEQSGFSPALAKRLADREGEVARLTTRATALRASAANGKKAAPVSDEQVGQWAVEIQAALDSGDAKAARDVLAYFVQRVTAKDGTVDIEFTFPIDDRGETRQGTLTPTGNGAFPCIRVRRKLRYTMA